MFVTGNSRTLLFVSNKYRARTINLIGIKIKFIILNKNRWKILLHVGYEFIYTRTTSIPINNGSLSINISRFYEFHPIEINYQFVSVFVPFFLFTNSISRYPKSYPTRPLFPWKSFSREIGRRRRRRKISKIILIF